MCLRNLNPTHQLYSGFSMAASSIPTIKHHHKLNNAEPIKQDPSKFYYHFLYKSLLVAIFLIILLLFPSQAPDFINHSLLTRNWELLHLLFFGIAISYGLFCRRNDGTDKENNNNNNSKFDTAQSYVSRFLQVSSFFEDESENETPPGRDDDEDGKIQTRNNYQYHRNEPVVVVAPKKHSNSNTRISEKPLRLPVRSLKSRVVSDNHCPVQSVNESNRTSVSVNGSGSKSGSRRFSRNAKMEVSGSGRPTKEDRSKDNDNNVVLPSPIPWRSESLMKLQNSRISRPNPVSYSTSLSSPKTKDQSLESLGKNSEDTVKNKGFYKSSNIPLPPPPPPPMFFKSISMKPRTSSLKNQAVSSDKEMKRSFTTIERKDKPIRGLYFENNNDEEEEQVVMEEKPGRKTTMASVGFAEEEKVMMGFDEDTESEDEVGGDDEAGRSTIVENQTNNNEENSKAEQGSGVGEEGPDVDKKADEFIAKFREQIRLQRIDSIKRSTNRMARNSSR